MKKAARRVSPTDSLNETHWGTTPMMEIYNSFQAASTPIKEAARRCWPTSGQFERRCPFRGSDPDDQAHSSAERYFCQPDFPCSPAARSLRLVSFALPPLSVHDRRVNAFERSSSTERMLLLIDITVDTHQKIVIISDHHDDGSQESFSFAKFAAQPPNSPNRKSKMAPAIFSALKNTFSKEV